MHFSFAYSFMKGLRIELIKFNYSGSNVSLKMGFQTLFLSYLVLCMKLWEIAPITALSKSFEFEVNLQIQYRNILDKTQEESRPNLCFSYGTDLMIGTYLFGRLAENKLDT